MSLSKQPTAMFMSINKWTQVVLTFSYFLFIMSRHGMQSIQIPRFKQHEEQCWK